MAYKPIEINRQNLTIMGVKFSDLDILRNMANAIVSNIFECFEPITKSIEIIHDYLSQKITLEQLIKL
jgi:putative transcriptional regulator